MALDTKYTIYAIQCSKNGKVYIGATSQFQNRVKSHFNELRRGKKTRKCNAKGDFSKTQWQLDYDKYGESAFDVYLIEICTGLKEKQAREMYWINEYDSANPGKGYNWRKEREVIEFEIKNGAPPKRL